MSHFYFMTSWCVCTSWSGISGEQFRVQMQVLRTPHPRANSTWKLLTCLILTAAWYYTSTTPPSQCLNMRSQENFSTWWMRSLILKHGKQWLACWNEDSIFHLERTLRVWINHESRNQVLGDIIDYPKASIIWEGCMRFPSTGKMPCHPLGPRLPEVLIFGILGKFHSSNIQLSTNWLISSLLPRIGKTETEFGVCRTGYLFDTAGTVRWGP